MLLPYVTSELDTGCTCNNVISMPVTIQIRHVPDSVHRRLKAKAALEGMSLSDLLRCEVERMAERPALSELRERLASRSSVKLRVSPSQAVRAERERS